MRILLTGGTGYIGSHTAIVLMQAGHRVVLYDNLSNSTVDVVQRIEHIAGKPVSFVKGDVRDTVRLEETIKAHNVKAVVHFAGLKAVGESVLKPLDYFINNTQGTLSVLQAMKSQNVSNFVFSSSATVYGEPEYLPYDEVHPTRATSPYGRSKLHIEEILNDLACSDPSWSIACLRYFNPVGAHESGLIGEMPSGIPNNLMPYIAQVAAGERAYLNVFGNDYPTPDGTGVRDYIHVMDLAEGHASALNYLADHRGWYAINLGSGVGHSVLDMVSFFEQACSRKIPYRIVPRRPGDIASFYANPSKARELLSWTANRGLREMCESTWKFQQQFRGPS